MKAKPIVLITVTLIIGFILGMLTSAQIRYTRLKHVRVYLSEDRFRDGFYRMIQPDDKQKESIDKVLIEYAKQNSSIQGDFRRKMDSTFKELWRDLEPLLTKEQLEKMKEMDKTMEMMRRNRRPSDDSLRYRGDPRNRGSNPQMHERGPSPHRRPDSSAFRGQ